QRTARGGLQLVERTLPQRVVAGPFQRGKDRPLVAESNLAFGRMHVDIDLRGIDRQAEHGERKAIRLAKSAVRLLHGERQVAMLDAPAVDEDDDVVPGAPMQYRWADQAA